MATAVSPEILSRCGEFVARHLGLHFPESRRADLERGIRSATVEFGFDDPQACMRWLMSAPLSQSQAEVLASHLTVGETYFFREKRVFEALEHRLLADLIASRSHGERRLRIWSAGCSTGEEPYSVAILLKEMVPDLDRWNVTILGTDINARALGKASDGVYGEWSFRGMAAGPREKYTRKVGARYALRPDVARMVTFAYHNLVEDAYPSVANNTNAMDVILCCNVLMYFTREVAQRVVDGLRNALVDGGWLLEARILAVADVVEAMGTHRPYRPSIGLDAALDEIEQNRGRLYDLAAADACLRLFRDKGFQWVKRTG
jgi:chemotaxis protein methyltransferase CheR